MNYYELTLNGRFHSIHQRHLPLTRPFLNIIVTPARLADREIRHGHRATFLMRVRD